MARDPIGKALCVLAAMSAGSALSLQRLAGETRLPKSSIVRVLGSLERAGYVRRVSRTAGYQATARTQALATRLEPEDRIVEAALEPMRAFTRTQRWPLVLATRDGLAMRVRFGTTDESPYAVDPNIPGYRSPMLLGALGRAYLAFCPAAERAALIAALRLSKRPTDRLARDPAALRAVLREVRARGYAATDEALRRLTTKESPRWRDARRRASGIAIPVMTGRRVAATLVMRYLPGAIGEADAARRYLPALKATAEAIAAAAAQGSASRFSRAPSAPSGR
jgi:IclR family mhp operon transcriptional activator